MIIYIFGNLYILGSFIFFNWKFRNTTCFQDFLRYSLEVSLLLEDQPKVETTDGHNVLFLERGIYCSNHTEKITKWKGNVYNFGLDCQLARWELCYSLCWCFPYILFERLYHFGDCSYEQPGEVWNLY